MILINYIKSKLQINFVKQFLTLLTGSVSAELILFAFTPLLTRIYSEEAFGIFFMFSSVAMILRVVAGLRFELALVLPKKNEHAINLFITALFFNLIINSIFLILIYFLNETISEKIFKTDIGIWLYILPVSSFFLANFEIFSAWSNRIETYKSISISKIGKSTSTGIFQTAFNFIHSISTGLIAGLITGQIISVLLILKLNFESIYSNLKYFSIQRAFVLIRKYLSIPIFNTLLSLISVISQQLPLLMLGSLYGTQAAAFFGLAMRIVSSPTGLIADAIGKVFYKKSVDMVNLKLNIFDFVKKSFINLYKIAIVIFVPIFIISFFFGKIFGDNWSNSELITRIMLPWLFLSFLHNPVSWIITVLNKQKTLTVANIFLLAGRFLAIWICFKQGLSFTDSIIAYSVISFLYSSFIIVFILNISKNSNSGY